MASVRNRRSFSEVAALPSFHRDLPRLAKALTVICRIGDREVDPTAVDGPFQGTQVAQTSVHDYLVRVCKHGHCSKEVFMCMGILVDRYQTAGAQLTSYNIHRVLLTCFVIAAKLRDDTFYSNKFYATVGGVHHADMNVMERHMLRALNFMIDISAMEYEAGIGQVERRAELMRADFDRRTRMVSFEKPVVSCEEPVQVCEPFESAKIVQKAPGVVREVLPEVDDHGCTA
eukprot:TRINITY_DN2202_c2_g1_i1.p2 TRINITY_DN2202_c2_g1~~TRINITY_DN2202_c2_g1_i1.p2  ORF type:complete len:230 (+),score=78.34 TRINITY_DN2202_c2_g1_i1:59-748(+)